MKETLAEFLARGGTIEIVTYKSFEEIQIPKTMGGMRAVVKKGWNKALNEKKMKLRATPAY